MSGGYFDYKQFHIDEIAGILQDYLHGERLFDDHEALEYIEENNLDKKDIEWIKEHKRTLPNKYHFSDKTIAEMKKGLSIIEKAAIYSHRIDYLLSGDDTEESFIKRLNKELEVQQQLIHVV